MSDFKQRIVEEKSQLDERTEKLGSFLSSEKFESVSVVQKALLKTQHTLMSQYSMILEQRLNDLG